MLIAVCSERSSCPCFAAALSGSPTESVRLWHSITFGRLMKFSRYVSHKEKYRPRSAAMDFVGVSRRQNESGVLRGGMLFLGNHPLKVVVIMMSTTTFVSRIWSKGYHGSVSASIWFWKIYYGKSIGVRLLAVKHYGGWENNAWAMDTSAIKKWWNI